MKAIVSCIVLTFLNVALAEPPVNGYLPPRSGGSNAVGFGGSGSGFGSGNRGGFDYNNRGGAVGGEYGGGSGFGRGSDEGSFEPANYEFSYEVKDPASGNDYGHSESRQGDFTKGKYFVLLPDGRTLIVDYTADEGGYKPQVRYEGEARVGTGFGGSGAGGFGGVGGYNAGGFGGSNDGGYNAGGASGGSFRDGSGSYSSSSGYRY